MRAWYEHFYSSSWPFDLILLSRYVCVVIGTSVVMWPKKEVGSGQCGNQLWFIDSKTSTIRSKFCNLCLTARDNSEATFCSHVCCVCVVVAESFFSCLLDSGLCVMPFEPDNKMQHWTLIDGHLRPRHSEGVTLVPTELKAYSPITLQSQPADHAVLWEFRYR